VQELKKTLKEDARLILQLKGAVETVKDEELLFKPQDRDLILQVGAFLISEQRRNCIISFCFSPRFSPSTFIVHLSCLVSLVYP
jgi:hypothetical protein